MDLRTPLLRANALFLKLAAVAGLRADLGAAFLGSGPFAPVVALLKPPAATRAATA